MFGISGSYKKTVAVLRSTTQFPPASAKMNFSRLAALAALFASAVAVALEADVLDKRICSCCGCTCGGKVLTC